MAVIEASCVIQAVTLPGVTDLRLTDICATADGGYRREIQATLENGAVFHLQVIGKDKEGLLIKVQRPLML